VTDYVRDPIGREWATAARAAEDLGVTAALIRTWASRYPDIDRHTVGARTWYRLDHLRTAEVTTGERLTRASSKRVDA
jgi:hypothetical protein